MIERAKTDIVIMGGCGHVGLPLGIALADRGLRVDLYDISADSVALVNKGEMPFMEPGAEDVLRRVIDDGMLQASDDRRTIGRAGTVILVIGTPIDKHLNPDPWAVRQALADIATELQSGQLLVLRSTVYPGVTRMVEALIDELGLDVDVAFCPERIAEGKAMTELYELPQIVASRSDRGRARAEKLFRHLTDKIVYLSPEEAELAKLFTNTWRYIKFATANQLFMIANSYGLDFERIRLGLADGYQRAEDMPGAGFAAGPCLFKDTMQLAAFDNNNFTLGHAAMMINEGLPMYVISQMERTWDLSSMSVGILGMAFKGGSDDVRSSLSYKLKRILGYRAKGVLCTDEYVTSDPDLIPLDEVLASADVLIIGAPHAAYVDIEISKPVVDIWNIRGAGVKI